MRNILFVLLLAFVFVGYAHAQGVTIEPIKVVTFKGGSGDANYPIKSGDAKQVQMLIKGGGAGLDTLMDVSLAGLDSLSILLAAEDSVCFRILAQSGQNVGGTMYYSDTVGVYTGNQASGGYVGASGTWGFNWHSIAKAAAIAPQYIRFSVLFYAQSNLQSQSKYATLYAKKYWHAK